MKTPAVRTTSGKSYDPTPPIAVILSAALVLLLAGASTSSAFHFFRGNENGGCSPDAGNFTQPACCPATGQQTDDPLVNGVPQTGPIGATVLMLHNSFNNEAATTTTPPLAPGVVVIQAGQAVEWRWASYHCHSVTAGLPGSDPNSPVPGAGAKPEFDSGFLYPQETPPAVDMMGLAATPGAPGFLDFPIPDLDRQTLSFVHTFTTPGEFPYHCVHHQEIGMEGVVIVLPASVP